MSSITCFLGQSEVYNLLYGKLNDAQIILDQKLYQDKDMSLKDLINSETLRIKESHISTATIVNKYLYKECLALIKATDLKKIGSVEMGFILSIVGGWVQGIQILNNQPSGELKEKFIIQEMSSKAQAIEKLFDLNEFKLFQKEAISLITDFSKNLSGTLVWIKETLPVLKKQEAVVREFGEFLSTNPKVKSLEFENAMSKTQKELLPYIHDTTGKSLYWTERRNDFGLLDPFKQFLVNAHALLDLLDVLHYAGYMNLEDDCNFPPTFIKIRS